MERAAQQPELITEADYWRAIESLGGMIWSINHDMAAARPEPAQPRRRPFWAWWFGGSRERGADRG